MQKTKQKLKAPPVRVQPVVSRAWAWKIKSGFNRWSLCCWSEPDKATLLRGGKPSPEAKAVRVTMRG